MIVGNPNIFAVESQVQRFFRRLSQRALGLFAIHLGGLRYGVYEPDATMLGCSFYEIRNRIADRGIHRSVFSQAAAAEIAVAMSRHYYDEDRDGEQFLGLSRAEFSKDMSKNALRWAPDGDEAFDDGGHVLQFDVEDRVRLLGFRRVDGLVDISSIRDVWIKESDYYDVLSQWYETFQSDWQSAVRDGRAEGSDED